MVNTILMKTRRAISDKSYDMVPTEKNKNSRKKYGLTILEIEDLLFSLTPNDLVRGPVKDRDYPNDDLFIFKKEIVPGVNFYIKLKEKDDQIKILSFHEDEH